MQRRLGRRVHGGEFKAQVLAECQRPERIRGGRRAGSRDSMPISCINGCAAAESSARASRRRTWSSRPRHARSRRRQPHCSSFPSSCPRRAQPLQPPVTSSRQTASIDIELRRAGTELRMRWPATQAESCAAWLRDLAAALAR
ncbi:MAG: hypothetical protein MZW92_65855 [Comamonadaceae bacterium]|nr:hypothetical protein [Comamonadaceae bacterium]